MADKQSSSSSSSSSSAGSGIFKALGYYAKFRVILGFIIVGLLTALALGFVWKEARVNSLTNTPLPPKTIVTITSNDPVVAGDSGGDASHPLLWRTTIAFTYNGKQYSDVPLTPGVPGPIGQVIPVSKKSPIYIDSQNPMMGATIRKASITRFLWIIVIAIIIVWVLFGISAYLTFRSPTYAAVLGGLDLAGSVGSVLSRA